MLREDIKFIGMPEKNEFPPKISVRFTCPECGGHDLNLESADVLGSQRVRGIDELGKLVLDRPQFYTDESNFYLSCPDCGHEPAVDLDVEAPEEFIAEWLKANFASEEGGDDIEESETDEE